MCFWCIFFYKYNIFCFCFLFIGISSMTHPLALRSGSALVPSFPIIARACILSSCK
eukprot:UN03591